jgi:hypothetical protein
MGNKIHNLASIITNSFKVDTEAIEKLRLILEEQNERQVSFDEADDVARSLVTVMETLANGRLITTGEKIDGQK